ncbi:MAG: peptide chain release factor N(5)-glutamine methyltransferase [Clostridiales bacterium]|nr:peptide chain release factor N(5)-glutamine methyltransferase [Clostridiales bacterium]MCF8022539.1 peptide chain release factor N(5)-glutamine methyltransferase [Clostridiales bacterium]
MDIKSALLEGRFFLKQAGISSYSLDAEILLSYATDKKKEFIYREPCFTVPDENYSMYMAVLRERARGKPVAYLTGHKEFMGLQFKVDKRVLIPRPETELLVETALALLGGPHPPEGLPVKLPPVPGAGRVVDIGTGSGAAALSLAYYLPELYVYAADISKGALEVARHNACCLGVSERVEFLHGDLLEPLKNKIGLSEISLMTANLPYIPSEEMPFLPPGVKNYEPEGALDGGTDGLVYYRELLYGALGYMAPGGCILMEIAPGQEKKIYDISPPGTVINIVKDPGGKERLIILRVGT